MNKIKNFNKINKKLKMKKKNTQKKKLIKKMIKVIIPRKKELIKKIKKKVLLRRKKKFEFLKHIFQQSNFKNNFQLEMLSKLKDDTNWNTLFLNPNSVLEAIKHKFNLKKVIILI